MADNKIEEIILDEGGKVNISDEVVATIAGIAAMEIDGVYGMAGGAFGAISEKLGAKKSPQKGVKVSVTEEGAVIDLYIVVSFGVRIPELAWDVQENVKNSVETMTGIDVLKVNVRVDGVNFEKEKKEKKKDKKEVAEEPVDLKDEEIILDDVSDEIIIEDIVTEE